MRSQSILMSKYQFIREVIEQATFKVEATVKVETFSTKDNATNVLKILVIE